MKRLITAFGIMLAAMIFSSPLRGEIASRVCFTSIGCLIGDGTYAYVDEDGDGVLDTAESNLMINAPDADGDETVQGSLTVVGSVSVPAGSIDTTEILDDTISSSDISNTLDLGGDTSFEIPNGTNPTVDTTGEVAVDTTGGQLIVSVNGATNVALDFRRTENWVRTSPVDTDHWTTMKLPFGITLSQLYCIVDPADAAESIDINIQECDATADSCANNQTAVLTCTNTGATTTTFGGAAGATMDATDWLALDMASAPTGTVTTLTVTLDYRISRE